MGLRCRRKLTGLSCQRGSCRTDGLGGRAHRRSRRGFLRLSRGFQEGSNQIVITDAGFGERFVVLAIASQPLIEVDGKPIIAHVTTCSRRAVSFSCANSSNRRPLSAAELPRLLPDGSVVGTHPTSGAVNAGLQVLDVRSGRHDDRHYAISPAPGTTRLKAFSRTRLRRCDSCYTGFHRT